MFIKYGKESYLVDIYQKGELYFNPCEYFRKLEDEQKARGIADGYDGGIHGIAENTKIVYPDKTSMSFGKSESSIIVQPALKTPIYCLRKCSCEKISKEYREKLRTQFPEHTHALLIDNEESFLNNVRYKMRNKAFSHDVFYEDKLYIEFFEFICHGESDVCFYTPRSKSTYYMTLKYEPINDPTIVKTIKIDDSNYYKTMFRKDIFF